MTNYLQQFKSVSLSRINSDTLNAYDYIRFVHSPKTYLIVTPDKMYLTDYPDRTLRKQVCAEYPDIRIYDILIIRKE